VSANLLVIGLDAASATLLDRWADTGHLPHFARLRSQASQIRLDAACMETLPGAIWSDIALGEPAHRHGCYYHPGQFFPSEGVSRFVTTEEIGGDRLFWSTASRAGRRCAVVDVPFVPLLPDFNGVQIRELAVHDLAYGTASEPPGILEEALARHGRPAHYDEACDRSVGRRGRTALIDTLAKRARSKTAILCDLLDRDAWDLFFAVYGETHCAGHQLFPERMTGDDAARDVWEPLRRIYADVDEGIGRLIAKAGPNATVMLLTSHGMGPYLGGPQLIQEVLRRLGLSDGYEWPGRRSLRQLAFRARLSRPLADVFNSHPQRTRSRELIQNLLGASRNPESTSRSRAFAVQNNRIGAIRLNIAGRDAHGLVRPEAVPALKARICKEFTDLREPVSGERIVKSISDIEDVFPENRSALLPDLLLKFRTDLGLLQRCVSPRVGLVYDPPGRGSMRRFGDHVPQSRLWLRGARAIDRKGDILDIAPTILQLLGVPAASHMTGRALAEPWREAAA
jgi:predicted AlkP superfamily phosphohydrolase/phosphomutase